MDKIYKMFRDTRTPASPQKKSTGHKQYYDKLHMAKCFDFQEVNFRPFELTVIWTYVSDKVVEKIKTIYIR
jgi:hypothetical protein